MQKQTASTLRNKVSKSIEIKRHADDIIKSIISKATSAAESNQEYISLKIPVTFDVTGIKSDNAQLLIYVEIIKELEEREFKVKIDKESGIWYISGWDITYNNDINKRQALIDFLASRTLQASLPKSSTKKKAQKSLDDDDDDIQY